MKQEEEGATIRIEELERHRELLKNVASHVRSKGEEAGKRYEEEASRMRMTEQQASRTIQNLYQEMMSMRSIVAEEQESRRTSNNISEQYLERGEELRAVEHRCRLQLEELQSKDSLLQHAACEVAEARRAHLTNEAQFNLEIMKISRQKARHHDADVLSNLRASVERKNYAKADEALTEKSEIMQIEAEIAVERDHLRTELSASSMTPNSPNAQMEQRMRTLNDQIKMKDLLILDLENSLSAALHEIEKLKVKIDDLSSRVISTPTMDENVARFWMSPLIPGIARKHCEVALSDTFGPSLMDNLTDREKGLTKRLGGREDKLVKQIEDLQRDSNEKQKESEKQ